MNKYTIDNELRQVERLRELYPPGTKIQCIKMDDPYHAVALGSIGTVDYVDDAGTIHISWENGSSLELIPGEDHFKIIEKSEHNKSKSQER
ncbi:DUF4314 domain-containing protein [Faecalicoccus pleomorphus]|uniref:DUF4314 domain-containing protein n=1 Tax=Faecalicoccus pleomorphus TaxID=1323 RepID=UPI00243213E8|nr:DUF4314 domain-containing protein [Faecalicoccus pleomorphus]